MSSDIASALQEVKKAKATQSINIAVNKNAGHVRLVKFRARAANIIIVSSVLTGVFALWMFRFFRQQNQEAWLQVGGPVAIVGLLTIFIRPSEEWDYSAWQSQAQQVEKTQYD